VKKEITMIVNFNTPIDFDQVIKSLDVDGLEWLQARVETEFRVRMGGFATAELNDREIWLLENDGKIPVVKSLKDRLGLGLKESMMVISKHLRESR
jgi:ribosomal protein L7/L12